MIKCLHACRHFCLGSFIVMRIECWPLPGRVAILIRPLQKDKLYASRTVEIASVGQVVDV